jgi:hypothetical protein
MSAQSTTVIDSSGNSSPPSSSSPDEENTTAPPPHQEVAVDVIQREIIVPDPADQHVLDRRRAGRAGMHRDEGVLDETPLLPTKRVNVLGSPTEQTPVFAAVGDSLGSDLGIVKHAWSEQR